MNESTRKSSHPVTAVRFLILFWVTLMPLQVGADTFTVGSGGTHTSINAAIASAIASAGDDEIRVATDTYFEVLEIFNGAPIGGITLSGGWNASFDSQVGISVMDAEASDTVFNLQLESNDQFILSRMHLINGRNDRGGGIDADLSGDSLLRVENTLVASNTAEDDRTDGGGLLIFLTDNSRLEVTDSVIDSNTTNCSGTVDCRGGGINVQADTTASLLIENSVVANNRVTLTSGSGFGAGANIALFDDSTATIVDSTFIDNQVVGATSGLAIGLLVSGGSWDVSRNKFVRNTSSPALVTLPQVTLFPAQGGQGRASELLLHAGTGKGLQLSAGDDAQVNVTNVTAANHPGNGIQFTFLGTNAVGSIFNSIAAANGTNVQLNSEVLTGNNEFVEDPGFRNPGSGDYRIQSGSSIIDSGLDSPPGGLSLTDVSGADRIQGAAVDLGAYEQNPDYIFGDTFDWFPESL